MGKPKLYLLLATGCLGGYAWLFIYKTGTGMFHVEPGVCLLKYATGYACPSCGSTRSILSLMEGDITAAIAWNPLGILSFGVMLVTPLWIMFDLVSKRSTLLSFFHKTESMVRNQRIAIPAILLVLGNWIWNIYKGL